MLAVQHQRLAEEQRRVALVEDRARRLEERIASLRSELGERYGFDQILGRAPTLREALVRAARAATRRSLELAELRYRDGLSNYLDVLDAQRQFFAAEIDLSRTLRDQLVAVVQVYKALGGGWTEDTQTRR